MESHLQIYMFTGHINFIISYMIMESHLEIYIHNCTTDHTVTYPYLNVKERKAEGCKCQLNQAPWLWLWL